MLSPCPACGSISHRPIVEDLGEESFRLCPECGLQHVSGLDTAVPVFQDFSAAALDVPDRARANGGELPLTPNERTVLKWLGQNLPSHSHVLELCCESGRFLMGLRYRDFEPLGMDPLPTHVEVLQGRDCDVAPGSVDVYPPDWPEPNAVVLLESLVRFPDPAGLIGNIARRFPGTPLCLSVPSPRRSLKVPEFDRRLDYPPHHLTRWTPRALKHLLARAGYRARCWVCHVHMNWSQGSVKKKLLRIAYAASLRVLGELDYSICAVGLPNPKRNWKP
jgi:hypothetical protein